MSLFQRKSSVVGVAVLLLVWFLASAWLRPLALPDEGRYVGIAWEMMRSGDWLVPTLDGLPYFHKPPLFYWITAAAMSLLGPSDLTARAAPILGAWVGSFGLYLFLRRWSGERTARLATVALASMPLTYLGAQYANMDMLVAGLIAAAVLLLADAALCLGSGAPHRTTLVCAYAAAGLGVLAKGLIGAALPLFVIVAWLLVTRRARWIPPMISLPGLAAFFLITMPWFVALQWRFPGFLDYFFVVQQVKRFAETGFNNARPVWFYPALLAVASLPWLPWFVPLIRRRRGYFDDADQGVVRWLMLVWVGVVTLFFSIPQSKLPGYILPAVPPLAYFVADALRLLGRHPSAGSSASAGLASGEVPVPGATADERASTQARRRAGLWLTSAAVSALIGLAVVLAVTFRPLASTRDLALALARERAAGEPVFMLQEYYFDLPFYARLTTAVSVVDAWDTADARSRDNWRKELADAGDFAPAATAAAALVTPAALPGRACAAGSSWFVGAGNATARYPFLALAQVVRAGRRATLWRLDSQRPDVRQALGCEH